MNQNNIPLETLFKRHYRQMHRLATVLLHDEAESKDIVHDVFEQLIASPQTRLREETAAAFLLTCVRNRCLNAIRSRRIQENIGRHILLDLDTTVTSDEPFQEELKALREGIDKLAPPVCREIVERHFRDGLTFREIALLLGVSETTVYKHLRSALSQLRTHIKKD